MTFISMWLSESMTLLTVKKKKNAFHLTGLCFVSAHWVIIIFFVEDALKTSQGDDEMLRGKNKGKKKKANQQKLGTFNHIEAT